MKKILNNKILAVGSAAIMTSACVGNIIDNSDIIEKSVAGTAGQTQIEATLGDASTKTVMSAFDGKWKALWQKNDVICVYFDGKADGSDFKLERGEGMSTGLFSGNTSGDSWSAIYPSKDAVSFDGTYFNLMLPGEQTYVENSFGPDSYPMVASRTSRTLQFKNLCSTIKIQLKGHHIINSIVFSANDESVRVNGDARLKADFSGEPSLQMGTEGNGTVTLNAGGVMLDPETTTDFYIVLPAQKYNGGFTLKIVTPTGTMTRSTTADVRLERSKVHALTQFYVKIDDGIEPNPYFKGTGSEDSPLIISGIEDFVTFAASSWIKGCTVKNEKGNAVTVSNACFRMENDIDLSALCNQTTGSWTPICYGNSYSGVFDGNGHKITNLYVDTNKSGAALFFENNGTIKNLYVYGTVKSTNQNVGMIASSSSGLIENCVSNGSISAYNNGETYAGGIVGFNTGTVNKCSNHAESEGSCCIGGIVGNNGGTISNCNNYSMIAASDVSGGIAGFSHSGITYNSTNFGDVEADTNAGGIFGAMRNDAKATNCLNIGEIYSTGGNIGGIFAYSFGSSGQIVSNCVNVGKILAPKTFSGNRGGICGESVAEVSNCYWLYDPDKNQGEKKGISSGENTYCFGLTNDEIRGLKSYSEPLYFNKEGIPSINLIDALNNWAADKLDSYEYWGWQYDNAKEYLTLTGKPADGGLGDISSVFVVTPAEIYTSYEENEFNVKVISGTNHRLSSNPEWISLQSKESSVAGGITTTTYVFKAQANPDYVERRGVIVFCNESQKCISTEVTQMEKVDESDLWKLKNFYHRSVGFKFTATWCQYCPAMAEEWDYAKEVLGDKFQIAAFHPTSSDLGFSGTDKMLSTYQITGYPTGVVDGRAKAYGASYIKPIVEETASAYGTSSGIEFTSVKNGNAVNLEIKTYIHEPGDYKITALLLEDNIIGYQEDSRNGAQSKFKHDNIVRYSFTAVDGEKFNTENRNSIRSFKYSGEIPSSCDIDNLRILVYVQRAYGEQNKVQKVSGADYISFCDYYIDNANIAALGESAKITFDDGTEKEGNYESKDYSRDREVTKLQSASSGKGINIIITGDAFSDKDQTLFDSYADSAMEAFFAIEPYNSLRDRFNVWKLNAVSKNDHVGGTTKFSTGFGEGTLVSANNDAIFDFTDSSMPEHPDFSKTLVIVLVNSAKYAGTNYCWSDNSSISLVPLQTSLQEFNTTLRHEAAGHGFGKLDDEYEYGETAPENWIASRKEWQQYAYGFWENVDFTDDPETIRWSHMIKDSHYKGAVGVYRGGGTYRYGVWKPTENSIMRHNTGFFNAPSREAIYKKIMLFSKGDKWAYDYEEFVAFDEKGRREEAAFSYTANTTYGSATGKDFVPLHAPVLMTK